MPEPRSLVESLRAADPESVARLLRLRPDLLSPPPSDLTDLAARAATASSVQRCLERLDADQRLAAEALAALPAPATTADVAELTGWPLDRATELLGALSDRALVWGRPGRHLVREARVAFGAHPGGLAAPSATPLADVADRVVALPEDERRVVDRLAQGPPTGQLRNADRPLDRGTARTPVERLLAAGLLRASGPDTVVLPREVALAARGGFVRQTHPSPPPPVGGAVDDARARRVDLAAVGAAFACVHEVEAVVDEVGRSRPALLRGGGLGASQQATLARRAGVDIPRLARSLAVAVEVGLLQVSASGVHLTTAYDRWLAERDGERWTGLVRAWLGAKHWAERDPRPLQSAPDGLHARAAELRTLAIRRLLDWPVGRQPDADDLAAALLWHRPAWAGLDLPSAAADVLAAADWLGLTALSGRSRLAGVPLGEDLPEDLAALFPEPVDTVILQADLTAVAAGPVRHDVLAVLRLLADQESRGGAAVFRFSAGSVRRGLDRGWGVDAVRDWLREHSRTGLPQPLDYLLGDVARHHGALRVGPALSWVRVEDESQAALVAGHPRAAEFGIRRPAPGVLISAAEPEELLEWLRGLGLAPVGEGHDGQVLRAPEDPRIPARRQPPESVVDPDAVARELVGSSRRRRRTEAATGELRETLEAAIRAGHLVDLAWVNADGDLVRRRGRPVELVAGRLRVELAGADTISLALGRVQSAVAPSP